MNCCDICEKELIPEGATEHYLALIFRKEPNFEEKHAILESDYFICSNCMKNFKELFRGRHDESCGV